MALGLLNQDITPVRGNAALLPNQPILHTCVVASGQSGTIVPGDVVTLATGDATDKVVVKKAAVTDLPIGVVVGNAIATGFKAGDHISVFPVGSYVYMTAGAASIARGSKLQFQADGDVVATTTATYGYIGTAYSTGVAEGDLIIVHIEPGLEPGE